MAGNTAIITLTDGSRVPCEMRRDQEAAPVLPLAGGGAGAGLPAGPDLAGHEALRARLAGGHGALQGGPPEVIVAAQSGDSVAHEDVRTLPVKFDSAGKRFRNFVEAAALLEQDTFPDWIFDGPRTTKEFIALILRKSNTPSAYHSKWLLEPGVDKKSAEALVHEIGMDIIEAALAYDQLNGANLACLELLARWMQMTEHAVAQNPKKPEITVNPGVFLGNMSSSSAGGLTSTLAKHMAAKSAEEAAVLKEQRKAREERALLKK